MVDYLKILVDSVYLFLGESLGDGANCNSYLATSENEILLVDSGFGQYNMFTHTPSDRHPLDVLKKVIANNSATIKLLALTHAHLDHSGGVASLDENMRKELIIGSHKYEQVHLEQGDKPYIDPISRNIGPAIKIDRGLSNGDQIKVGLLNFEVLHTAGHTEGSICLYEAERKWLFSGDTVFPSGSFGRVDFPGSNADDMIMSLDTIRSLEVEALFAGHMDPIFGSNVISQLDQSYKIAKSIL